MKKIVLVLLLILMSPFAIFAQEPEAVEDNQEKKTKVIKEEPIINKLQTIAKDGILMFQSSNDKFRVWFDVRVQADGAVFVGAPEYADKIGNGMNIRRARWAIRAQLDNKWYGEIDTDWTSGKPEIRDAIIAYNGIKGLDIRVGNFKENFSLQLNSSSRYLLFMERPMITALAPARHLGINATYYYKWLWASAGVFGPALKDADVMKQMQEYNRKYGLSEGLAYTGKFVYRPLYKLDYASLHVGAAYSYRNIKTTSFPLADFDELLEDYQSDVDAGKFQAFDLLGTSMSSRTGTNINRKKYLDTGNLVGVDYESLWTIELIGHWRGFCGEAAYIARTAHMDPAVNAVVYSTNRFDKFTGDGWYIQSSYLLFGGHHDYNLDDAKYTRITPGRKWGDIELAARFQTMDLNDGPITGGKANMYELGVNYYPSKNVKIMLNYAYVDQDRFANGNGQDEGIYFVGYNGSEKTKKSSEVNLTGMKGGVDYHMLSMRFQVIF